MAKCIKCNTDKNEEEFSFKYKAKGVRANICKICKRIIDNNYYDQSEVRRFKLRATALERKSANKEWFKEFKSQCSCAKCGVNEVYMLDFHHIDPNNKDTEVSKLLDSSYSLDTIKNEILKCIVLCANHHREFHYLNNASNINLEQYLS